MYFIIYSIPVRFPVTIINLPRCYRLRVCFFPLLWFTLYPCLTHSHCTSIHLYTFHCTYENILDFSKHLNLIRTSFRNVTLRLNVLLSSYRQCFIKRKFIYSKLSEMSIWKWLVNKAAGFELCSLCRFQVFLFLGTIFLVWVIERIDKNKYVPCTL